MRLFSKRHCFCTNHANHRRTQSIMPTKETSLWLISFLASPRCLVSRSQESFNSSAIFAEFSRAERMTWFDFASNIGGITGVTLGISFVSLLEVFYWVFIRFCGNLIKNKEQKMRPHMQKNKTYLSVFHCRYVCITLLKIFSQYHQPFIFCCTLQIEQPPER